MSHRQNETRDDLWIESKCKQNLEMFLETPDSSSVS